MPDIIRLCDKYKICTSITFNKDFAELSAIDCESSESMYASAIKVSSPTTTLELKGSNAVQALAGVQTYLRRYLYIALLILQKTTISTVFQAKKKSRKNIAAKAVVQSSSHLQI